MKKSSVDLTFTKGQIISKRFCSGRGFSQKTNENMLHTSKNKFICSFFGRILGLIKSKVKWKFRKTLWPSQNMWTLHLAQISYLWSRNCIFKKFKFLKKITKFLTKFSQFLCHIHIRNSSVDFFFNRKTEKKPIVDQYIRKVFFSFSNSVTCSRHRNLQNI